MQESTRALRWLYSQLSGISGISGVFRGVAPGTAKPPFIIINWQAGSSQGDVNGHRLMDSSLWQIKAVGPSSIYAQLETIADAIDTAIHRNSGSNGGADILVCEQQQPIIQAEDVDGVIWMNVGSLYRTYVSDLNPA